MNRTIGSTLGPRALNMGSFNYFELIEMLMAIKHFSIFQSNLNIKI